MMSADDFGSYNVLVEEMMGKSDRLVALRNKGESEKHKRQGGVSEGIGMKTNLNGPIDFAKTLTL